MDRLGEPIGKQDQYIAAFGNLTALTIGTDGAVEVEPVPVRMEVLDELESNLVIVYSGIERPARVVLGEQGRRLRELEPDVGERFGPHAAQPTRPGLDDVMQALFLVVRGLHDRGTP